MARANGSSGGWSFCLEWILWSQPTVAPVVAAVAAPRSCVQHKSREERTPQSSPSRCPNCIARSPIAGSAAAIISPFPAAGSQADVWDVWDIGDAWERGSFNTWQPGDVIAVLDRNVQYDCCTFLLQYCTVLYYCA
ncbi:hypothetical protein F5884DRAFT_748359 [Xylogone sp. PMI_703]|nr:hypothetical protein F5884DRAFT_748359 [Xylogone sp. PMI_703]